MVRSSRFLWEGIGLFIVCHHVRVGLSRFRFSGFKVSCSALRARVSSGSLIKCPSQLKRLFLICVIHVVSVLVI